MGDNSNDHYQTRREEISESSSRKDRRIQAIIAVIAIAALVLSGLGLVWSKESATAAKRSADAAARANQLSAQANQLAQKADSRTVQDQESAQARDVTFTVYWNTTSSGSREYFVQIINLSASAIRNVLFTYGQTAAPSYYAYVNLVRPCSEWQALEEQQFSLQLYFEDSTGNYWEIDSSGNLHHIANQPSLSGLTETSNAWTASLLSLSCAP